MTVAMTGLIPFLPGLIWHLILNGIVFFGKVIFVIVANTF
jgi:hypothetical protein